MTFVRPDLRKKPYKPLVLLSSGLTPMDEAGCERSLTTYGCEKVEMKRCPTCRQLFRDTAFRFCRSDGTPLVNELVPLGDAPTILFSATRLNERFPWLVADPPSVSDEQPLGNERKAS